MNRTRITIMLDAEFMKKIRLRQAKKIQDSIKSVTFSDTINEVVRAGLKNVKV